MSTILNKEYVVEDKPAPLRPTELGFLVTDLLVDAFPDILNVEFTAGMEDVLDEIEEGKQNWVDAMRRFYDAVRARPRARRRAHARRQARAASRPTSSAPKCGATMVVKWGRGGEFLACPRYPECKSTKNFTRDAEGTITIAEEETTDEVCEKLRQADAGALRPLRQVPRLLRLSGVQDRAPAGPPGADRHRSAPTASEGEIMEKRSRSGKTFYSCNRYPHCKFATWDRPVPEPCPQCSAPFVVEKTTKRAGTVRRCLSEGCKYQGDGRRGRSESEGRQ